MDISIVSGTYNRLELLKRMVDSVRRSLGGWHGLRHEFVLVDGGSVDGTLDWCRGQPDVRLIEHGKLLGAIKAFNDGAYAATGDYVILANDDIQFLDDGVYRAWMYMQEHPDCGIGCFYQDRNKKDWHIETMPCIEGNQQVFRPYGQVCIVPRWLGDQVGWWGRPQEFQALGLKPPRTYGGDNELSANIYEAGYRISPVPEAKIHDDEFEDDLRKLNNLTGSKDPRAVRGHHPDSWAWGRKWRRQIEGKWLVGPVIRQSPACENTIGRRERILYLPIYEPGWGVQKRQKRGLREALANVAVVAEYDYMSAFTERGHDAMQQELNDLIRRFIPTLFVTQLHNPDALTVADVRSLKAIVPGVIWVNWNGDFWPENLLSRDGLALARAVDLQLTVNRSALDRYQQEGINAAYWQIGWEPDGVGHEPDGDHERHDLVFLASGYSPARRKLAGEVRGFSGLNFGLYGTGWPKGWSRGECLYDFITACRLYRGARFSLGDSQWPDTGFVSNRVMQALAAGGSALCHQWFRDMDRLGLVDGQTCIVWRDVSELREKLSHYLAHEDERRRVAQAGEALALAQHSFDVRVQELFEMLGRQPREVIETEHWRW